MKVFLDVGHPAHVHYFKNLIGILKSKGHQFVVTARDKDIAHYLLNQYDLNYVTRGKGSTNIFGKFIYLFKANFQLLKIAIKEKPDLFLSFGSPYCAQVSKMIRKDHIAIDDTENAGFGQLLYRPFSDTILSPSCFEKNMGSKHLKFPSYMELSYLHPNIFEADKDVVKELGVKENEKYVILRFVHWGAVHDVGHLGMTNENKIEAVNRFKKYAKVFVSSEDELPSEIAKYRINIAPERMHHALAYASMFYGESATMASESAVLGTPAIYLDNEGRGYTNEQEKKYGLVFNFSESKEDQNLSIKKGIEILISNHNEWQAKRNLLLDDKIDVTAFMVWFIENYPESKNKIHSSWNIQEQFKLNHDTDKQV